MSVFSGISFLLWIESENRHTEIQLFWFEIMLLFC